MKEIIGMSQFVFGTVFSWARLLSVAVIAACVIASASVECSAAEKKADDEDGATKSEADPQPCVTDKQGKTATEHGP